MRFTGTVLAVLVANLLTICLLAGGYFYLKSDHGQMFLYEMGLHSYFFSAVVLKSDTSSFGGPSEGFKQPGVSDMQPMIVTPSSEATQQPALTPAAITRNSDTEKRNQSAIRSSLKMCRFWNAEYKKDGSSKSKTYRDAACRRYERFSGSDSEQVVNLATSSATSLQRAYREQQEKRAKERRLATEKRAHEQYCQSLSDRIDHYDSLLRSGGKARYMNELKQGRRELSIEYSRKCLLDQ